MVPEGIGWPMGSEGEDGGGGVQKLGEVGGIPGRAGGWALREPWLRNDKLERLIRTTF